MKKTIISILTCVMTLTAWGADNGTCTRAEVMDIITKVNNTWQEQHPEQGRSFWDNAVYHTGNMEVCDLTNNKQWFDYSYRWGEKNLWAGAREADASKWLYKNYGEDHQHVLFGDWQICFQTYLDLYRMMGKPEGDKHMVARALEVMRHEAYSQQDDYWWWADALYMVMPVMTKMYQHTGDAQYLLKMYDNWQYANGIMYDKETGLYFRDGKYVYPKHTTAAGKKDFWARGDGWVMAAFAKVLKDMPLKQIKKEAQAKTLLKQRAEYVKYYQRMAEGVAKCQQEEGYWTRSMMDAEQAPGRETSGTALFCYAYFWGINNGVLDAKKYAPVAEKAWHYLSTIALQPDNTVGYVQPIGEKAIPGQVVNQKSTSNFGTGAFLLAACEYYRYLKK